MTLTDDELLDAVTAYQQHGNERAAAKAMGLAQSTLHDRLKSAARRGLLGFTPVLPGYQLKRSSEQRGPSGEVQKEWVSQEPEHRPAQEVVGPLTNGHTIKGVSTLLDAHGNVIQSWVKTGKEPSIEVTVDLLRKAFESLPAASRVMPEANVTDNRNMLAVYPVPDLHLGQYSWKPEVGEDYDLYIASDMFKRTIAELVSLTPGSETAILLNMGDFFHSDSNENRTRRSGNALDVDTRYAKVLQVGVELTVEAIELLLLHHNYVLYRAIPGNHDPYATLALVVALAAHYRNHPRVIIDTTPSPFWFYQFGKVLLGAIHGDMARAEDMPGIMAAKAAKEWGATEYRYVYTGHLHTRKEKLVSEKAGAQVEVFQTLAPRDAWGNSMGFVSGRSLSSITHTITGDKVIRQTINVRGPA